MAEELRGRLKGAQRVVIKAGTSVVSTPEGYPSLVRLANIVEQVGGNDMCVFVSSYFLHHDELLLCASSALAGL